MRTSIAFFACALAACGGSGDVVGYDGGHHDLGDDGSAVDGGGFDAAGLDLAGFDAAGFDAAGFDAAGFDAAGFDGAGTDAAGFDAAGFDAAGTDAAGFDAAGTDAAGFDAAGFDAAGTDAAGTDAATGDGGAVVCGPDCTSDAECGASMRCLPGGRCPIGSPTHHCERAGRLCLSSTDCHTGERCDTTLSPGVCVTLDGSECASSSSCPTGYACETDTGGVKHCIDRRATCRFGVTGCPAGYVCGLGYCDREVRPCTTLMDCSLILGDPEHDCVDVDGNGSTECIHIGTCTTNADCPGATCDNDPAGYDSTCGPGGLCASDAACGTGTHCVDVHGDGYRQCIPLTGCQHDTECATGQLCNDWDRTGTSMCRG